MKRIWSDENRLARWLEVELAALEGWTEVGAVPREAVGEIRDRAVPPTADRVAELEEETQHDVAAFVDAVAAELGESGRWFHYGLTSSDVLDTATALQVREAGALLLDGSERAVVTAWAVVPAFVVDNQDAEASVSGSGWFASANAGYYASNSLVNLGGDGSADAVTWRAALQRGGMYDVYAW